MTKMTVIAGAVCAAGFIGAVVIGAQDSSAKPQALTTQSYCASGTPYCGCSTTGQGCFVPAVSWAMLGRAAR